MCRYNVTSFACGHDLLRHRSKCETRVNAGPFIHFPPCETTEPLKLDSGICTDSMTTHQRARVAARAVHARNYGLPTWKRKMLVPLSNVLDNHLEASAVAPSLVSRRTPPFPLHGRGIRAGPQILNRPRGPHRKKIPAHGKATSTLSPKAIPSPVLEGEEPKSESGSSLDSRLSWSTGDDLPWQSMPLQVERTVHYAQAVSGLEVLPSQLHPLRQNPSEKTLFHSHAGQPPLLHPTNEIWEPQRRGRNVQKPHPNIARKSLPPAPVKRFPTELEGSTVYSGQLNGPRNHQTIAELSVTKHQPLPVSASEVWYGVAEGEEVDASPAALWYGPKGKPANIDRLSRAEQQDAELFFRQYDPKTLAALEAGSLAAKEVARVPTVLRAGRPRPDSTYVSPTVGQIPAYYNAYSEKFSNRHAKLSTREEVTWENFILTNPTTSEMAATAADLPPSLPPLTKLPALSLKEEIHLSCRISHPGLHDSYIPSPKPTEGSSASPASGKKRAKGGKKGNGKLQKKPWQIPRHRDGRPFSPEPECAWDEIVCNACVSLKSPSTVKSNASDS